MFLAELPKVVVVDFVPKQGVKISANEKEEKARVEEEAQSGGAEAVHLEELLAALPEPSSLAGFRVQPAEFEKDDDTNFHMDFITACSNLRAENYEIAQASRHKTKGIAGRIIPAIATTTATVAGFVCLELYKLLHAGAPDLDAFKNGFINLALPFYGFSTPIEAAKVPYRPDSEADTRFATLWDVIEYDGNPTLAEFLQWFKDEHKVNVQMMSSGVSIIYSAFGPAKPEKMKMRVLDIIRGVSKTPLPADLRHVSFEVMAADMDDDEDVELPTVRVKLPALMS